MRAEAYLIKRALGGSPIMAKITRPFTQPALGSPAHTLEDQRTLDELFASLPPSRREGILRAIQARMRARR